MSLMLIDSASLWYRAYYGMPDTLVNQNGQQVGAIRGYLDALSRLVWQYQPTELIACIDSEWRPTWRTELYPGYKANRVNADGSELEPETLTAQIPIILEVLDALGIHAIGAYDYEADDVIASFCQQRQNIHRLVVTGDRDLFQLVDLANVQIVYLAKGIANHDLVDQAWIQNRYEIPGDRYALFAMIRGDASDGLPGIKGIGEKGAAKLANSFASMEEILIQQGRVPAPLLKKIIADIDYAKMAPVLVNCARDVALPNINYQIPSGPADLKALNALKENYSLGASLDRLVAALYRSPGVI